jgi:hypothetical protein
MASAFYNCADDMLYLLYKATLNFMHKLTLHLAAN